jgi:hypothetical protein
LPAGDKFSGLAWQISQRHVDGTWQMTWRRSEFLELTHIDEDNGVARRKAALQFNNLDPCRRIHAWPSE